MPFVTNSSSHSPSPDPEEPYVEVPAPRDSLADALFWREVEAFNSLPQPLIDNYYGQYVAVYEGNIVDADPDEGELALRFYRTFGYVPVYIHKVGTEDGLVDADDR
ncbi:MAG: hypothetical protein JO250_07095 [Armatimonadetes bacterium]|nr:hypothetical protein [Armatimonadota bacterium]